MKRFRPLLVFGTRPEAIKMAPVVHECIRRSDQIEPIVCLTGQHREMLEQVTEYFGIRAQEQLDVMTPNQTLARLTARCVEGIDEVIARLQPDCVIAQGDTTSVMAASLVAFYRRIRFVHVEAGLRSCDLAAPWPEELNRRIASLVTSVHCAPTERSRVNLLNEGYAQDTIHVTGNTVVDALLATVARERANSDCWHNKYSMLGQNNMVLITGHRRENSGTGFRNICSAIVTLADKFPDVAFVYPVHLNPNVQRPANEMLSGRANIHLVAPAAYPEFVWLMDRSTLILTDSGGVQEEAPSLKKPVLVMRDNTERPEALEAGATELVGTSTDRIVASVTRLLTDEREYARRQINVNPYGDGRAAERIVSLMVS